MAGITLIARRTVKASVERVFAAWTEPELLRVWWGPRPVTCAEAEVDLRVGGRYRIVNALPDGARVTIQGEFRLIDAPRKLVYTWHIDDGGESESLVTVRFEPRGDDTEVIVQHDEIASDSVRDSHERGWDGCLEGLAHVFAD